MKTVIHLLAAAAALVVCSAGQAATITAQSGFGTLGSSFSPCKSVSKSAAFATGEIVSGGDQALGCVGYYSVTIDTTAKTITLTGLEFGNYETGFLDISGISGETITGLSLVGANNLFDPGAYGGSFATDVPSPLASFTSSSIHLEWTSIGNASPADQFAYGVGGLSVFDYTSISAVPEPETYALLLAGLGVVGFIGKRRKAS